MSKLAQISPAIWVKENNFVNEKGELITFDNHLFQWQIFADMNPESLFRPMVISMFTQIILTK